MIVFSMVVGMIVTSEFGDKVVGKPNKRFTYAIISNASISAVGPLKMTVSFEIRDTILFAQLSTSLT
jgi:hypothetical protein